jgi:transcriptional regulator with XRE-family HTH domain
MPKDPWQDQWREHMQAWGTYVRRQRELANLSLRQLAELAQISNPYLSQLERGMHAPSVRIIRSLAEALGVPPEEMFEHLGIVEDADPAAGATDAAEAADDARSLETAIARDRHLTDEQKQALLAVYRSYRMANEAKAPEGASGAVEPPPRKARARRP